MARGDSARKVARAARAGDAGGSSGDRRRVGFPVAMAVVVILGVLLVGWARSSREATSAPRLGDHWHSVYDVYSCIGEGSWTWRPKIVVERDPDGIHTHGDGLIHIHPFNSNATGRRSQLGVFFEAFGGYITDSAVKLDTGEVIEEGFNCEGQPAVLTVARFDAQDRGRDPQLYTQDLADIRFLKNLEAFTIGFLPAGETPPPPRPERFTFLETVDPRALISNAPVLELPTTTTSG